MTNAKRNIQYALERWAEATNSAYSFSANGREVWAWNKDTPTADYRLQINHKFFAELPMGDEERFVAKLFFICTGYHPFIADPPLPGAEYDSEDVMAFIKSTIDQLLAAYWEANHESK